MSLEDVIQNSDTLVEFHASFREKKRNTTFTLSILEAYRLELYDLWRQVKTTYHQFVSSASTDEDLRESLSVVKAKYQSSSDTYVTCLSEIIDFIKPLELHANVSAPVLPPSTPSSGENIAMPSSTHHIKLPPCDTEIFYGNYLEWPTFRDMFTAVYINHPKISPVQKLFHLRAKTKGDASNIVNKFSLTDENFNLAWTALKQHYENKRILVNNHLKVLLNQPPISCESAQAIKELQSGINDALLALKANGLEIDKWDAMVTYICSTRLPATTLALWEDSLTNPTDIPSWESMNTFLSNRFRVLESVSELHPGSKPTGPNRTPKHSHTPVSRVRSHHTKVTPVCKVCKGQHPLRLCPDFLQMDVPTKRDTVRKFKYCYNCLAITHPVSACTSTNTCFKCQGKHHTLLHSVSPVETQPSSSSSCIQSTPNLSPNSFFSTTRSQALLATAIVRIRHHNSDFDLRALLDPGSEVSFIAEDIQARLKLPTQPVRAQVAGMSSTLTASSSKMCTFTLCSKYDNEFTLKVQALVLRKLTGNLPSISIEIGDRQRTIGLQLADPFFNKSSRIDLLIGADLYPFIIRDGIRNNVLNSLMAQNTVFGWVLLGPLNPASPSTSSSDSTVVSFFNEVTLEQNLQNFWKLEELPQTPILTSVEEFCETLFAESTYRDPTGRYVVRMPFKEEFSEKIKLGSSRAIARSQFMRNESRLLREPTLKKEYDTVLTEYRSLGHMQPTSPSETVSDTSFNSYYLPHHAVIKPDSLTTKVRVVFNASQASSNGTSLNDLLYPGPTLQSDITLLMLNWRFYKYVFNSDIEKMYRQIMIHPDQTAYQRILFRESPDEILSDFELKTVTFGVTCAPYLAIRTLRQLADDVKLSHPLAATILNHEIYVDDVLSGAHDLSTARQSQLELIEALNSAGFHLRKWTSNSLELLEHLPKEFLLNHDFLRFEDKSSLKMLGIKWNAISDQFSFSVQTPPDIKLHTKRSALSVIARLFDPAGWLAPIVVTAKILMQQIWKDQTDWDTSLLSPTERRWKHFLSTLSDIETIRIPRWVEFVPRAPVLLVGFCDASEMAYAACLYLRVQHSSTSFTSHLLRAKSKVAPVSPISLPRLELQGAVLLSKLIRITVESLPFLKGSEIRLWTDSTIVLAWLKRHPSSWKTFIANRTSEILRNTTPQDWYHVASYDNPADLATRGLTPLELKHRRLWWEGPHWLKKPQPDWPSSDPSPPDESLMEQKPIQAFVTQIPPDFETLLSQFSTWPKAIRILAYIYRFIDSLRSASVRANHETHTLSYQEILRTKETLIRLTQQKYFSEDYQSLSRGQQLVSKSWLAKFNAFIDNNGLVRSHGRLSSSTLSFRERFPILLPYNCAFTRLYISFVHKLSLHGEIQLMTRMIRSEYWIPRLKNLVKRTIRECQVCTRHKKKLLTQLMGALPKERTTLSRPFTNTGIDFAGPFLIKTYFGRRCRLDKGYVCLFVCFSTRAIHLEAVSDLTAQAFLAAFTRFVARRGTPTQVFSDHGTNFVGSEKLLFQDCQKALHHYSGENSHHFIQMKWTFIPPGSPHMGGLWEAGVKSFKLHFRKVAGNHKFTFEEFTTLLARIESSLNSRPLSPMSDNVTDMVPLTPGHFLTGSLLVSPPEPPYSDHSLSIMNRWRQLKILHHQFCTRWKEEYLKELHKRNKWKYPQRDLQVDDLVIVRNENLPPNEWRLGRVLKVYPGSDQRVRVADIKTQRGIITRSIAKLCVLLPQ